MTRSPVSLTIRTYNVGFGDCFLLTFDYTPKKQRHIMIDFGSQEARGGAAGTLRKVAASIRDITGNKLHVVVATHRHQDHIRGFGTDGAGDLIEAMAPDYVLQPWTEDPSIAEDAVSPISGRRGRSLREERSLHLRQLSDMNALAEHYFTSPESSPIRGLAETDEATFRKLGFIGANNIKNRKAVEALIRMAEHGQGKYLHAGQNAGLSRILPGVSVDVLGPPTVDQHPDVRRQRAESEEEYWHLNAAAAATAGISREPFAGLELSRQTVPPPVPARWFAHRLRKLRLDTMLGITLALDNAMNNTSLILLFTVGDKAILFPGDAQLENWQYAMGQKDIMEKLKKVDVYKVGHHGSLNATPRTVWENFEKKGPKRKSVKRLTSLLSTLEGKHGDAARRTEVPRKTLLKALLAQSDVTHTEEFSEDELYRETVVVF